ncbi:ankyrin repeat-containing domain protein [Aspergillus venezuelensis]
MAQRFDGLEAQQQQLHQARAAERLMKKHQECHVVFKTSKYQEFKDFNREAVLGTWEWITKTERYKLWKNRSIHNLLWIAGEPGSGKSVLARYIFDNDLPIGHPSAAVCHFFFKDNNAQNSLATALCAILHQLFSQQPHLIRHAVPLWQSDGESIKTEVETLWKILLSATSDNEPRVTTICVLDAFDECDEKDRDKLVQMLKEVQGRAINAPASVLKILVTGRPYMSLSSTLQALVNSFLQIRLHDERYLHSVRNDIKLVIESQMKEVAQNPLTKISPPVQQRLVKELLDTGGNTYLWVQLVMEDLQDKLMKSLRPHKVKIDSLPGSVDDAYAEILKRVEKDHADVKMVLMIIVGARRALHCWEMGLAQGLVTEPDLQTRVDALADEDAVELKIRQICGGFIVIHDKFIHLHHQTAKEYLLKNDSADALKSKFCFSVADADELWANICLNYLLLDKDPKQEHESALTNHLGEYVSENWVNHLHSIPPSSRLRLEEVVYIIYAERYNEWHHSFWGTLIHHGHGPKPAFATHAAAVNGHTNILRRLLKTGKEHANQADNMGTTALLWSSWAGQYEASELLIDHGAKVNAASKRFGTPLLVAALKGHLKLVKLLLENGADANQLSGKRSMVQRQNSSPEEGYLSDYTGTALWAAALMGHLDIVKLLLDHGATDVDFALMSASRGGQLDVMRFLIEETNANRNAGDDGTFYGTAVQAASLGGHIEALELLVNAGFHDSEEYGYFESGLVAAACNGHDKIVQFHLDRGSYRYHDSSYMKALETACITGNLQIATALAPLVEDINATPLHSRNRVLQTAFEDGYPEIVLVLLHNKASFQEDNMLPRAARRGYVRVVEFLLEKGIDIDKGSPLLEAASAGHEEVVTLLVANGADVDQGYPLAAAARSGHDQIVKDLVEAGADVNGDCPLHAAIRHDHVRIAVYLIEKGANVNARRDGQTAFDVACAMNVEPMIRYILQQGGTIEGSN